jgi:hypothetical protein
MEEALYVSEVLLGAASHETAFCTGCTVTLVRIVLIFFYSPLVKVMYSSLSVHELCL